VQGQRPQRVGDQIREDLSDIIRRELKDPGIGFVTITHVKVSPDLQVARVYYTSLGDEAARRATAKALQRAAPFLRRQVGARVRLRRVPELHFTFDESVERGERIEQLLREIKDGPHPVDEDAAAERAPGEVEDESGDER
jgi:ribosome-binding factor A